MTFQEELDRLDASLATAERQAKAVLAGVRGLRRQAATGTVAGLARRLDQLPSSAEPLAEALRGAAASFAYDAEAAFADGAYLAELKEAARAKGLVLTERDGRVTAFPLLLKLDGSSQAVRVGRKLERQLRPDVLAGLLKRAQERAAFNAAPFLETLFKAAAMLAGADSAHRPGAVAPLLDIYDVLTLRPGASAEYPREAFAVDVLRLDRAPDTRTRRGHGFSLPASTGSKGRSRLTVYDEHGAEHVYVGIAFHEARDAG